MEKLVKSPERLAMEVRGTTPEQAKRHLERYGLSEGQAAEALALYRGKKQVTGGVADIADLIAEAVGCDSYGRMEDSTVQALAKTALEPEALFQWLGCNEK